MKIFVDTSVLVAASDSEHPHHQASIGYLVAAERATTACAGHTLAELYAVLSKLPGSKNQRPAMAHALVEQITQRMTTVLLTGEEYLTTIAGCAKAGHAGGMIYDALLLACARKVKAERVLTWNIRHFKAIAPDLASRISEP